MMTPFDVWAPMIRAPFSGDVTQEIVPRVFSPNMQGVPEIETKIHTEVASYGKQLGKVLDALQTLAEATKTDLPEIDELLQRIGEAKATSKETIRSDAERALARLRAVDEDGWCKLVQPE